MKRLQFNLLPQATRYKFALDLWSLIIRLKVYGIIADLGYYRIYRSESTKKKLLLVKCSLM